MNNEVFGKKMKNVRKHRDIKLVTTDRRRNQLVSELNYHTSKHFSENLMAIEMKKTKVKMNKPIYIGMSISGMVTLNQNMEIEQNYVTRILTVLLFIVKLKIFIKTFPVMLKNGLTHLTMKKMAKDRFQQVRTKK